MTEGTDMDIITALSSFVTGAALDLDTRLAELACDLGELVMARRGQHAGRRRFRLVSVRGRRSARWVR